MSRTMTSGLSFGGLDQQFPAVPDYSNHITFLLQYRTEPFRYDAMIIGNEHAATDCRTVKIFHNILIGLHPVLRFNWQDG